MGYVGWFCIFLWNPVQIRRMLRAQSVAGVSPWSILTVAVGLLLYLAYSIHILDPVYMFSNTAGVVATVVQLGVWLHVRNSPRPRRGRPHPQMPDV